MKHLNDISWKEYSDRLAQKCADSRIPQGATFELTPLCNFKCRMCYIRLEPKEMDKQGKQRTAGEWLSLGREAAKAGTIFLLLTGGEIFTRPDFDMIYMGLSEMGFIITLFTNGYLMTDEIMGRLIERPPVKVRITMYGASDETYEKVCKVRDGYTVVICNIEKLKAAGITVSVAMTVIRDNAKDLEAVREYAKKMDMEFNYTREITKSVRGAVSDAENVRFHFGAASEAVNENDKRRMEAMFPRASNHAMDVCGSKSRCFWVTWDGKLLLCSLLSSISEPAFNGDFIHSWNCLCDRIERLKRPLKCIDCKYMKFCVSCPGVLESETGNPQMTCDTVCDKAKAFYKTFSIAGKD